MNTKQNKQNLNEINDAIINAYYFYDQARKYYAQRNRYGKQLKNQLSSVFSKKKKVSKKSNKYKGENTILFLDESLLLIQLEMYNQNLLTESHISNVKNETIKKFAELKNFVKKYDVPIEKINNVVSKCYNSLNSLYESEVSPEFAAKKLQDGVKNEIVKIFNNVKNKNSEVTSGGKIFVGILGTIIVIFINTLFIRIFSSFFGQANAIALAAVFVAPFTEETLKYVYTSKDMPWTGTTITFGFEALAYVIALILRGISLGRAIFYRSIGLLMHYILTYIHKIFYDYGKKHDSETSRKIGWIIAVLAHLSFNLFAVLKGPRA